MDYGDSGEEGKIWEGIWWRGMRSVKGGCKLAIIVYPQLLDNN
jgi:hypothetical protein